MEWKEFLLEKIREDVNSVDKKRINSHTVENHNFQFYIYIHFNVKDLVKHYCRANNINCSKIDYGKMYNFETLSVSALGGTYYIVIKNFREFLKESDISIDKFDIQPALNCKKTIEDFFADIPLEFM